VLVAVGADAIGRDEGGQQVVVELGGVVGGEAAGAHVPGQGRGIGAASRGVVIGQFGVDAPVGAGVVVRGERQAVVVAELGGVVDREPARALVAADRVSLARMA
jgi:hypothetical protein